MCSSKYFIDMGALNVPSLASTNADRSKPGSAPSECSASLHFPSLAFGVRGILTSSQE